MKLRYKIISGILGFFAVGIVVLAITLSHTSACGPAPAVSEDVELMQAITSRCYGSADVIEFVEIEKPVQAGDVTPVIDRRYVLSEVPDAIRYSEEGHVRGKIVIDVQ